MTPTQTRPASLIWSRSDWGLLIGGLGLSLIDVGARDASAPLTHVILAGIFGAARRLIASLGPEWDRGPEDERLRWQRDCMCR